MAFFNAIMVGVTGAILFVLATILLTVFASWMYKGDPTGQGAYAFSLFLTIPTSAVIGLVFGLYLGLS